jgi:hypothetical protein
VGEQQIQGIVIQKFTDFGEAGGGEFVRFTVDIGLDKPALLLLPFKFFQPFVTGMFAAGTAAHTAMIQRFGNDQNVKNVLGSAPFSPTDYEFGHMNIGGDDILVLRLKQGPMPVVDVALSYESAQQIGRDLVEQGKAGKPDLPKPQ